MAYIDYLEEYIGEDGKVNSGMFKGWDTTLKIVPLGGGRTYIFMPYDKINGNHSFEINLTLQDVKDSRSQKNMFDFILQHQASHELAKDALNLVKTLTGNMLKKIERETSSTGSHFHEDMPSKDKVSHAKTILHTADNGLTYDDAWMFKALPKEFWRTPFTRERFMTEYFAGLDELANFYNTPESIVTLRAMANEISGRIFGAVSDALLDPKLRQTVDEQNKAHNIVEGYRDKIIKFDDKMNVAEKRAEGWLPRGDGGK